ncbi:MAG: hypothetical protein REH83_02790 [Rickettsiella sp.]|nr:hypothetical protein [Rickettsiella sp.]
MNANNPLKLEEDKDLNTKFSKINEKFNAIDTRFVELNKQLKVKFSRLTKLSKDIVDSLDKDKDIYIDE